MATGWNPVDLHALGCSPTLQPGCHCWRKTWLCYFQAVQLQVGELQMPREAEFCLHDQKEYVSAIKILFVYRFTKCTFLDLCPDGYEDWMPGSNFCYKLNTDANSREQARNKCHWDNAALLSTTNKHVIDCVAHNMKQSRDECDFIWTDFRRYNLGKL